MISSALTAGIKTAFLPLDDDQADPSDPNGPAQGWSDRWDMAKFALTFGSAHREAVLLGAAGRAEPTPAMMKRIGCTMPPAKASV